MSIENDTITFKSRLSGIEWKGIIPRQSGLIIFMGQTFKTTTDYINYIYFIERYILKGYVKNWFDTCHKSGNESSGELFLQDIYQKVFSQTDPIIRPREFPETSTDSESHQEEEWLEYETDEIPNDE